MTDPTPPRLILFPGLGADGRQFDPQRNAGIVIDTPAWIDPRRGESLADYGKRMAESLEVDRPFVIGGSSFGGTVALEMARCLQPEAVILIGSCRSYKAVPRVLRMLAPLAGLVKPGGYKTLAPAGLGLWLLGEKVSEEDGRLLHQMLVDAEPAFFRWAAQAIVKWRYEGGVDVPIHHIHGDRDRLLRSKVVREDVDVMVEDAGHMINFTHADQVNTFLRESISKYMR